MAKIKNQTKRGDMTPREIADYVAGLMALEGYTLNAEQRERLVKRVEEIVNKTDQPNKERQHDSI